MNLSDVLLPYFLVVRLYNSNVCSMHSTVNMHVFVRRFLCFMYTFPCLIHVYIYILFTPFNLLVNSSLSRTRCEVLTDPKLQSLYNNHNNSQSA